MTLRLLRESGEPIKSTTDMGGFVLRCAASGEWRLLGSVDELGDTYFESAQMPELLADWDEALVFVSSFFRTRTAGTRCGRCSWSAQPARASASTAPATEP